MDPRSGTVADRPLPEMTPLTAPFWTATRAHRLAAQRCDQCRAFQFPPERACLACGGLVRWEEVSGRAVLYSWTVAYPPMLPFFAARAPWPVAVVELVEGPRLVTTLVDVPAEEYQIGMALEAAYEDVDTEVTLVVFRRART